MPRARLRTPEQEVAAYTYLSSAEVAGRLGCSPTHVTHLITTGKLRAIDIGAGQRPEYRVKPEWLEEFEKLREVHAA